MDVCTQSFLCSCSLSIPLADTHVGTNSQGRDLGNCALQGQLLGHKAITDTRDAFIQRQLHCSGRVDLRAKQSEVSAGDAGGSP